jgi:hypothetical protein
MSTALTILPTAHTFDTSVLLGPDDYYQHDNYEFYKKWNKLPTLTKPIIYQKCDITNVASWFNMETGNINMSFVLPDKINSEFKKHTGHDFPNDLPYSSEKILLNKNEINQLFPVLENTVLKKELADYFFETLNKAKKYCCVKARNNDQLIEMFTNKQNRCDTHVIMFKILNFINDVQEEILHCYCLYGKSYNIHVIDYKTSVSLIITTRACDIIKINVEKINSCMVSIRICNLMGEIRNIYNISSKYRKSINFNVEKIMSLDEQIIKRKKRVQVMPDIIDNINDIYDVLEELSDEDEAHNKNINNQIDIYNKNSEKNLMNLLEHEFAEIKFITKNNSCAMSYHIPGHGEIYLNDDEKILLRDLGDNIYVRKIGRNHSDAIIKNIQTNKIICSSTYSAKRNFSFSNLLLKDTLIFNVDGYYEKNKSITALYNPSTNDVCLYEYTHSNSKNKELLLNFKIKEILDNCRFLGHIVIPILPFDVNVKQDIKDDKGFLRINENINIKFKLHTKKWMKAFLDNNDNDYWLEMLGQNKLFSSTKIVDMNKEETFLEIEFSGILMNKQIMLFPMKCDIPTKTIKSISPKYNTKCLIHDGYVQIDQDIENNYELSVCLAKYISAHNININCKKNTINTTRLKNFKRKSYAALFGYNSLKIYSYIEEFHLENKNGNFYHKLIKNEHSSENIMNNLKCIVNRKTTHNEINDIILGSFENKFEDEIFFNLGDFHVVNNEFENHLCVEDMKLCFMSFREIIGDKNNEKKTKTVLKENVTMFDENDSIIEILDNDEDDNVYSIDEYNIGYITPTLVFVKHYDRKSKDIVTLHDLDKLEPKIRKDFDKMQSCHVFNKTTEIGKFDFTKETGLHKEHLYHMDIYMIQEDLILQDANNFIIVCGFGAVTRWLSGIFESSDTVNHSTKRNGSNSRVTHNGKEVFKKENGVILANKMKIGKIIDFPRTVWKVAHIKGTTDYCIIKLVLPDDTIFIRPFNETNWNGQLYMGKGRCNKAVVESIQKYSFNREENLPEGTQAESSHAAECDKIIYNVGDLIYPDQFDDTNKECSFGIHVFEERHHIVSLTGDEEVKPLSIIRVIMPNELNMLTSLAESKSNDEDKKISHLDPEIKDEELLIDFNDFNDVDDINEKKESGQEQKTNELDDIFQSFDLEQQATSKSTSASTYNSLIMNDIKQINSNKEKTD